MISLFISNQSSSWKNVSTLGNEVTVTLNPAIVLDEQEKLSLTTITS